MCVLCWVSSIVCVVCGVWCVCCVFKIFGGCRQDFPSLLLRRTTQNFALFFLSRRRAVKVGRGWGLQGLVLAGVGARRGGGPKGGGPTFRAFFLPLEISFFLLGGLLVEFWWCFRRPRRPNVHVWALWLSCETPALHTTTRELQTRTFERPGASNTTKIPREDPQKKE